MGHIAALTLRRRREPQVVFCKDIVVFRIFPKIIASVPKRSSCAAIASELRSSSHSLRTSKGQQVIWDALPCGSSATPAAGFLFVAFEVPLTTGQAEQTPDQTRNPYVSHKCAGYCPHHPVRPLLLMICEPAVVGIGSTLDI